MTDIRRAIGFVALIALLSPGVNAARAQRLSGVVRDSALQAPLAGAVVSVLDASRAPLSSTITDETGRYSIAIVPSAAQLRVVHIGFQPRVLALPRTVSFDITLLRLPTLLTGVAVNDERLCSSDRDRRAALSLWEQARAAFACVGCRARGTTRDGDARTLRARDGHNTTRGSASDRGSRNEYDARIQHRCGAAAARRARLHRDAERHHALHGARCRCPARRQFCGNTLLQRAAVRR